MRLGSLSGIVRERVGLLSVLLIAEKPVGSQPFRLGLSPAGPPEPVPAQIVAPDVPGTWSGTLDTSGMTLDLRRDASVSGSLSGGSASGLRVHRLHPAWRSGRELPRIISSARTGCVSPACDQ
jgi:hypothetical protein